MWTGGRLGQDPCGRPHRNLQLESTDVILSSSHAKKLAPFCQNFVFGQKKRNFLRYKLVIEITNRGHCINTSCRKWLFLTHPPCHAW